MQSRVHLTFVFCLLVCIFRLDYVRLVNFAFSHLLLGTSKMLVRGCDESMKLHHIVIISCGFMYLFRIPCIDFIEFYKFLHLSIQCWNSSHNWSKFIKLHDFHEIILLHYPIVTLIFSKLTIILK